MEWWLRLHVCYIWTSALRQGYPQPTAIYVSPLQRTLQTAAILFPEHPGIHVARSMSLWGRPLGEIATVDTRNLLNVWGCLKDHSTHNLTVVGGQEPRVSKSSKRGCLNSQWRSVGDSHGYQSIHQV